jgi:hypothetical protein
MTPLKLAALLEFLWDGTHAAIIEDQIAHDPALSLRQLQAARAIVETISGPSGPGPQVAARLRTVERAIATSAPPPRRARLAMRDPVGPWASMRQVDFDRVRRTRTPRTATGGRVRSGDSRVLSRANQNSIAPPPEPRTVLLDDKTPARVTVHGLVIVLRLLASSHDQDRTLALNLAMSGTRSRPADASVLLWRDTSSVQSASVDAKGHAELTWTEPGPYHLRIDAGREVAVLELVRPDPGDLARPT